MKKQNNIELEQIEWNFNNVLQFVKSFTIYYIKCVCPRIWVSKLYVQELRLESMKKNSTKKA
jgi:hypothetical protein